ncbi:MAG: NAD(P)H-dependent oxidoreductase, partial [Fibrobacter sp.]|nr:NAD(P)H-dependent oxidoreductase [Fibrobacter sp.]
IVWQFPLYWYSVPSALRDWQDQVLSAIVYGKENFLKGKSVLAAFTAGAAEKTFRAGDLNGFGADEMLRPLQMTVNAAGMRWLPPFGVYGCGTITDTELAEAAVRYKERLGGG